MDEKEFDKKDPPPPKKPEDSRNNLELLSWYNFEILEGEQGGGKGEGDSKEGGAGGDLIELLRYLIEGKSDEENTKKKKEKIKGDYREGYEDYYDPISGRFLGQRKIET